MSLEAMGAATAIVVSLASLYVALRQTFVMERQLEASVWPSLIYETGNTSDSKPAVTFGLKNGGVGPARVRSLEVSYQGHALGDFKELLSACSPAEGEQKLAGINLQNVRGRLLTPGQEIQFLEVPSRNPEDPWSDPYWKHLDDVRFDVDGRVCYCSALEQCWTLGFHESEPTPVRDCVEASKRPQYGR